MLATAAVAAVAALWPPSGEAGLVIYSAMGPPGTMIPAFEAESGLRVTYVNMAGGSLQARLYAEGRAPRWTVAWFIGDAAMAALDQAGLLARPLQLGPVPWTAEARSTLPEDGAYVPTGVTLAGVQAALTWLPLGNLAVPAIVLGAADLIAFNGPPLPLIGTPLALLLAQVATQFPLLALFLRAPVRVQTGRLGDAARVHGIKTLDRIERIYLPPLLRPLAWAWALAFGRLFFELPLAQMLAPDAWRMADRIFVPEGGTLAQAGAPRDLYAAPSTMTVARYMGAAGAVHVTGAGPGRVLVTAGGVQIACRSTLPPGVAGRAVAYPEGVDIDPVDGLAAVRLDHVFEAGRWRTRWQVGGPGDELLGTHALEPPERAFLRIDPATLFAF